MNGFIIKIIAIVTMFIDHVGAAVLYYNTAFYDGTQDFVGADVIYEGLRIIGRTAFPIFCFLLVEGFVHTKSVLKYALRLLVFALVSEVPFDLAFSNQVWDVSMQNVFFTLLFGLLALIGLQYGFEKKERLLWQKVLAVIILLLCMSGAWVLHTDYAGGGVLLIAVMYVTRKQREISCVCGYLICCFVLFDSWSFPAFGLMMLYNGSKGKGMKYFFYLFYPVHLLLLIGARQLFF